MSIISAAHFPQKRYLPQHGILRPMPSRLLWFCPAGLLALGDAFSTSRPIPATNATGTLTTLADMLYILLPRLFPAGPAAAAAAAATASASAHALLQPSPRLLGMLRSNLQPSLGLCPLLLLRRKPCRQIHCKKAWQQLTQATAQGVTARGRCAERIFVGLGAWHNESWCV